MKIEVKNISKRFGDFRALDNVSMEVPSGTLVALLGPSGSGKTTLLRIISGLDSADSGQVLLDGVDCTQSSLRERGVGFVFQHYALFRHMNVFHNVAFGLKARPRASRPTTAEIKERVFRLLRLVQLDQFADRYPSQLSGGQRQRVALARALAVEPRVLLLDEPFGSLDAQVRKELRRWLRRLHDELHITSVFVTHDQEEAMEVADNVVVMDAGHIEQTGAPETVYHHPVNAFVHKFIGDVNLFHGRLVNGSPQLGHAGPASEAPDEIFIRPHSFRLMRDADGPECFRATIEHINPARPLVKVELLSEWGEHVQVDISHQNYQELGLERGMSVYVRPTQFKVF